MASDDSRSSTSTSQSSQSSAFERWRRQAMLVTGIGVSEEERMEALQQVHLKRCEKMKKDLMDNSPIVTFMLKHLRLSGCQVPETNIFCGTYSSQQLERRLPIHSRIEKRDTACVRRRAITSVTANPACPSEVVAEKVVNEVWESCFNDTRPFDEIY
ncbi:metalloprotease atp23 [Moniliophthora roreri]|nr:metalloprotease atp23 [Moniliophthora roreri]